MRKLFTILAITSMLVSCSNKNDSKTNEVLSKDFSVESVDGSGNSNDINESKDLKTIDDLKAKDSDKIAAKDNPKGKKHVNTSVHQNQSPSNKKETSPSKKKDPSPKDEANEDIDLFSELSNKRFICDTLGGLEEIYFYKDGYFDGIYSHGNADQIFSSLYRGKFDIVEKIDDTTYKLVMSELNYQTPTGEKDTTTLPNQGDMEFTRTFMKSQFFGDASNDSSVYYMQLPKTKISEQDQETQSWIEARDKYAANDMANIYFLSKSNINSVGKIFMHELISESERAEMGENNYFHDSVYNNDSSRIGFE